MGETGVLSAQDPVEAGRRAVAGKGFPWFDSEAETPIPIERKDPGRATSLDRKNIPRYTGKAKQLAQPAAPGSGLSGGWLAFFNTTIWFVIGILFLSILAAIGWVFLKMESRDPSEFPIDIEDSEAMRERIRQLPFDMQQEFKGNFLETASQLAAQGDYGRATIMLFSHVLLHLDRKGLIRLRKGKTNRQYLGEIKSHSPISEYYARVMVPFEDTFFGDHRIAKPVFEGFWNDLDRFHQQVEECRSLGSSTHLLSQENLVLVFVLGGLMALGGCRQELKTGYGRAYGSDYSTSVNGTVVFQEMVKAAGHKVDRYRKISPRWENYQTVVWFPDGFAPPPQDVIDKIEEWLATGFDRTLVLVARDFDASIVYWDRLKVKSDSGIEESLDRGYAEAVTSHLSAKYFEELEKEDCDWYNLVNHPFARATELDGTLAEGIDDQAAAVYYSALPLPGDVIDSGEFGDYQVEVLLTVDGIPMVYSLQKEFWSTGSRIILVGNGSFLLNLPLANEQNRMLANNLIGKMDEPQFVPEDVLFIESTEKIAISEHDSPEVHSKWSWITREPLRYIVPNVLFWCLLACFVYFPIFGRPRKTKTASTANFGDHIQALGQLIRKAKRPDIPKSWIDEYRRRTPHSKPE